MKQYRNRRTIIFAIQMMAVAAIGSGCGTTSHTVSQTQTKATQLAMTPSAALSELKAGNERFAQGRPMHRDLSAERRATASGQFPFAVVLSCLDSRCSSEQVFDQGIGDIFNARVAGNVLNDDILGSMEFACKAAGARLIAVVGHTSCGAVAGACNNVELGHLTGLLKQIQPAVNSTLSPGQKADPAQVDAVARANVLLVMKQIRERSPILAGMLQNGQIALVGGMYDLESGQVKFID